MKPSTRIWRFGAILLCLAIAVFGWRSLSDAKPSRRLADGSKATLERVDWGTKASFYPVKPWKEKLPPWWPRFAWRMIGPNGDPHPTQSEKAALICWFTLPEWAAGNSYTDEDVGARLLDEHGCSFPASNKTWDGKRGVVTATGFEFESYPRRSANLKVQLLQAGRVLAEFAAENPAQGTHPVWPEAPAVGKSEEAGRVFELKNLRPTKATNQSLLYWYLKPSFAGDLTVLRGGRIQTGWRILRLEGEDATGNQAPGLCRYESAWNIKTELAGPQASEPEGSIPWRLSALPIPEPGQFIPLNLTNTMAGLTVIIVGLGGPGKYTYSNADCTGIEPLDLSANPGGLPTSNMTMPLGIACGPFGSRRTTLCIRKDPHLVVRFPRGIQGRQYALTLQGRDNLGHSFHSEEANDWVAPTGAFFTTSPGAKSVDAELVIQKIEKVSFLMKPPLPATPDNHSR